MVDTPPTEALASFGVLDEKASPIIYHYCSTDTFLAIIQNRCLRLSDINTMNDYGEMHWACAKLIEAINANLDKYDRKFLDYIDEIVSTLQLFSLPLISCFSREADMLSQWRAYADNGAGVALGLDFGLVKRLAVRCGQVVYDEKEQLEYFRTLVPLAFTFWKAAGDEPDLNAKLREFLLIQAFDLCLIKNPAFSEEKEVRLVRATIVERLEDGRWSLTDGEGSSDDPRSSASSAKQEIGYRARNGRIVPYIDLPLDGLGLQLVRDVVLGPRSPTAGVEVSMALTSRGYTGFKVRNSTATYR